MSKRVIFRASSSRLIDRVLVAGNSQLGENDLIGVDAYTVRQQQAIREYVRQFFSNSSFVGVCAPLEAFEQFASFDRDALHQVFRTMELTPVTLCDEGRYLVANRLCCHPVNVAGSRVTPGESAVFGLSTLRMLLKSENGELADIVTWLPEDSLA
jgi:hypothetical protein